MIPSFDHYPWRPPCLLLRASSLPDPGSSPLLLFLLLATPLLHASERLDALDPLLDTHVHIYMSVRILMNAIPVPGQSYITGATFDSRHEDTVSPA